MARVRAPLPWDVVAVLPNLRIGAALETELLCLVPRSDDRVAALEQSYTSVRRFLSGFSDAFRVRQSPSLLLRRHDAPDALKTMEAIAGFRDLVVASTVPLNRALELQYPRGHRIVWANSFWIYPWMTDRNNRYLLARTPGYEGLHLPSSFKGQSAPELPQMELRNHEIDRTLLEALAKRWERRFTSRKPKWVDQALFRSLNMANHASMLPAGTEVTLYDYGRLIGLWVSALEILAHPRTGQSDYKVVSNLLERVSWQSASLRRRQYKVFKARTEKRRGLASWLCRRLYEARNDFLHGNPISIGQMTIRQSGLPINRFAAPLYRLALTSFLDLAWKQAEPTEDDPGFEAYWTNRTRFLRDRINAEQAIKIATLPPVEEEN